MKVPDINKLSLVALDLNRSVNRKKVLSILLIDKILNTAKVR